VFRIFQHRAAVGSLFGALVDGLFGFIAVLLAAHTGSVVPHLQANAVPGSPELVSTAFGFAVVMSLLPSFFGLHRHADLSQGAALVRLSVAAAMGGLLTHLAITLGGERLIDAPVLGLAALYLVVGLIMLRGLNGLVQQVIGLPRVLIVGTGEEARSVERDLAMSAKFRCNVVGFYPTAANADCVVSQRKVLDGSQSLSELVRDKRVNEIIVAVREQRGGTMPMDQLVLARARGIRVMDLAGFYEQTKAEVPIDSLKASWLVYGQGFVQGTLRRAAKRVFDIATSGLLLVLTSPILLLTALAIKLDSPGPVFYRQERVGLGGRSFWCIKLRSMRTDAEKDGVARWAQKNDSRITRVGAFIRKTRIDELPQLISVLKGEMSMVGPRPERPSFVEELRKVIPYYDLRHSIKPGLTGWAQVRYAYGASMEDARRKHQFDLYYVKNNSIWLDIIVLIETVTVVLFREGAQ
jgi:sugar transferase (PEP-CTERM system associated)